MKKQIGIFLLSWPLIVFANSGLNLHQAEALAINKAPEIKQLQANSNAFNQDAIADGQWQDPKLMVGAINVPTNTFSFTQENMTQIQVGLMQQLPKGHTLSIRAHQDRLRAASTQSEKALVRLNILRAVRIAWLNAYYWQKAISLYGKERQVFQHLLEVNTKLLENNQVQQKDVVRAQFALSQIQQQVLYARQQLAENYGELAQWLPSYSRRLSFNLPHWSNPPRIKQLRADIKKQPMLRVDQQKSEISQQGIHLAQQQYIPGVNVGVVYGVRQGDDGQGQKRPDVLGAQVSMNLPVFTKDRQDKRLKASEDRYTAAQMQETSDYRLLQSQLLENEASWQKLSAQYQLYQSRLIPEAKHYAEATQIAYQNKQTDFPTLARAYISDYKTQLKALKTLVGIRQARVNLLYLQGH